MKSFKIEKDHIYVDGRPEKIISGSMHYFRIHPDYWYDRLLKLRECGCNCVETYVAWNLHEKKEGEFDFSGWLDLGRFIDMAAEMGLFAIIRPGPYICSEWDMGGLPWWLLKYRDIQLRCSQPLYLEKITPYLKKVCEIMRPRLITNGGNIIMVQVENEYGDVADDTAYMEYIRDVLIAEGIDCALCISTGADKASLFTGVPEGVYASVNYRRESADALTTLKKCYPDQPGMVMELWNGKAMHWGEEFLRRNVDEVAESVDKALEYGDLLNLYMFHGGTTFGFMNGAVYPGKYVVQMSSYDVDAPINEYGKRTSKYYAEQEVICKWRGITPENTAKDPVIATYSDIKYIGAAPLAASFVNAPPRSFDSITPLSMEECDQGYGYIVYETTVHSFSDVATMTFTEIHDVAHIYVDGVYTKTIHRNDNDKVFRIGREGDVRISVLVENLGRVNAGWRIYDKKGLLGDVFANGARKHFGYKMYPIPLDTLPETYGADPVPNTPTFYKYVCNAEKAQDTVLHPEGFNRGVAFINGFNLGRHWKIVCSDNKLFIPAPLIKEGENEIVIFDVLPSKAEKSIRLSEF